MLQIKLNGINGAGKYAMVSPEDYQLLMRHSWYYRDGYALAKINGKEKRMHRFLMKIDDPNILVDHKDRNRLNNQRENLRLFSHTQNANNRSDNVKIECFGERKTVAEWVRDPRCLVNSNILRGRLRSGVEIWAAILAP